MKQLASLVMAVITVLAWGIASASPGKTSPAPSHDLPSAAESPARKPALSGKVVETMNAGGYSYICIVKNGEKTWVAIPETRVKVGQDVTFQPGQEMRNFSSRSLGRTFESIFFSGGLEGTTNDVDDSKTVDAGHAGSKAAVPKVTETISVEKAKGTNAYTIAEIHARRAKLNKKTIVVKAKVVKVSKGIMDRNWIHLQDGTGDAVKGTNHLVATSQDLPAVGDVITMKGTVVKDKDFGAGYKYSVILEKAGVQH